MKKLTVEQSELLAILESYMHNHAYNFDGESINMVQFLRLAQEHKVLSVVYEQIRTSDIWNEEKYKEISVFCKRNAVRDVMFQIQRTEGFLDVYGKMLEAKLKPLVMKGIICRSLYDKPDYRVSSDEDILIPKVYFEKVNELLIKEGFEREEVNLTDLPYEISYVNKNNRTFIEVHFKLFSEEINAYGHLNDEFSQVYEHSICENIRGKKVWTLCPTEHLFYLICHSFKHFLHSGFGIRQVCDMIMMAEKYGCEIDWNDILERVKRLNMKSYWDALVKIGVTYLGFSLEKAMYPIEDYDEQIDCQPLLLDLMDSGIYGDSSMERKHSSNMTLTAMATGTVNTYASLGASIFPQMYYMKNQYSWLNKYPWLLPVAYVIRIVRYLKKRKKDSEDGRNSVQIGVERVELLKKYNIIE